MQNIVQFPFQTNSNKLDFSNLEIQTVKGIPELKVLGLRSGADSQIVKEKIRAICKVFHFKLPAVRKIIYFKDFEVKNINPAQADLQLLIMLLIKLKLLNQKAFENTLALAELNLDGELLTSISDSNLELILNQFPDQRLLVSNKVSLDHPRLLKINSVAELTKVKDFKLESNQTYFNIPSKVGPTFEDINNSAVAKLGLIYSLKMQTSLLLIGSTGSGKTMLFETLDSLGINSNAIHYLDPSFTVRKFQTLTTSIDKSSPTEPQILIMNELNDYSKSFLEYLKIFFDNLHYKKFNSKFLVLASINPCKCGNYLHPEKICYCNPRQVSLHRAKTPITLLDRFAVVLNLNDEEMINAPLPDIDSIEAIKLLNVQISSNKLSTPQADYFLDLVDAEFKLSERRKAYILKLASLLATIANEEFINEKIMSSSLFLNKYLVHYNYVNQKYL
jgi:magnesium chelatase family protein